MQDNPNTLPQTSQNQNPAHLQGGRGSRGGFRGRGGRGRGTGRGGLTCTIGAGTFCLKNKPITKWLIVLIKIRPGMPGGKGN